MRSLLALCMMLAATASAGAVELHLEGRAIQGGLVIGRTDPGAAVRLDGAPLRVAANGSFLLGFGRDAKGEATVTARGADGSTATRVLSIKRRAYDIQRIDGLPERQVTPAPEDLVRIRLEADAMKIARDALIGEPLFLSGFAWPAEGPISGIYGSQRILNGEPRRPHFGLDIAGPEGTPVRASADGVIVFAHPGMYFNGRTVVIDHGLGLQSVYLHLNAIDVEMGARVAKGETVGRIGATGRVTAAHLHWGLQLGDTWLDPLLVLPPRAGPEPHAGPRNNP